MSDLETQIPQEIKLLSEQLDLANSRMQSANHAFQVKTNEALELHAQFLLVQKKNGDLMQMQANNQKVIDELQKQICELTEKLTKPQDPIIE